MNRKTRRCGSLIEGFDYTTHQPLSLTRADWQTRIATALDAGGRRRAEGGETFIHGSNGRITAEIYATVSVPK